MWQISRPPYEWCEFGQVFNGLLGHLYKLGDWQTDESWPMLKIVETTNSVIKGYCLCRVGCCGLTDRASASHSQGPKGPESESSLGKKKINFSRRHYSNGMKMTKLLFFLSFYFQHGDINHTKHREEKSQELPDIDSPYLGPH